MNKSTISLLIIVQIFIICLLSYIIYKKNTSILGTMNINPIKKENIEQIPTQKANLYFEPLPDVTQEETDIFWLHKKISYHINKDGLHDLTDYQTAKDNGVFRIVALGDSFTYGMFVNTIDNWTEILERSLNKKLICNKKPEVLNLGVSGYDIQYSLERFKLHGQKYDPDLVIWFLKDDDFLELNEVLFKNADLYIKKMKATGEYDELIKKGVAYPYGIKLREDMEKYRKEIGEEKLFAQQEAFINNFLDMYHKKLLIITLPSINEKYQAYLKGLSEISSNIYYLEVSDIFNKEKGLSFLPYDLHPNEKGHQAIAIDILNFMVKHQESMCSN